MAGVIRTVGAVLIACLLAGTAGMAQAAPKASIVMDLRNGKVLYARSADRKLHPASLTKMMTLYLTFEALRTGKIRLDQRVRVSRKAARQPASKLYLKAGQRVTIRSLIRATAIKSANDAAMVLAETIGGSERRFGQMMTNKAKRLGMKNTRFKNPHGLTRAGHYSTARDMAKLGRHLFFDFPQFYNIFKRKTDTAAGRRIWTTNRLLSTYAGADGIKTGYTRAAGYNLVATAHRGKKRVIAVAFGERSSGARARKVAALLDIGFSRSRNTVRRARPAKTQPVVRKAKGTVRARGAVRRAPVPKRKPGLRESVAAAVAQVVTSKAQAATPTRQTRATKARRRIVAPVYAELPVPQGGWRSWRTAQAANAKTAKKLAARTTTAATPEATRVAGKAAPLRGPVPKPRPMRLASR